MRISIGLSEAEYCSIPHQIIVEEPALGSMYMMMLTWNICTLVEWILSMLSVVHWSFTKSTSTAVTKRNPHLLSLHAILRVMCFQTHSKHMQNKDSIFIKYLAIQLCTSTCIHGSTIPLPRRNGDSATASLVRFTIGLILSTLMRNTEGSMHSYTF